MSKMNNQIDCLKNKTDKIWNYENSEPKTKQTNKFHNINDMNCNYIFLEGNLKLIRKNEIG